MDIISGLKKFAGKRITILDKGLAKFAKDESPFYGDAPLAVIQPKNVKEVSRIMRFCYTNNTNVTVRGGGSSLTGASVPTKKGIVLDMSKFNRIIETNVEDRYCVVEPGAIIDEVNKHLSRYNYFYPPDPASSSMATIGGTISTNAGGLRAVMYGTTKDWILGLEIVLPNGEVIQTGGRVLKRSIGYDLTALMIGSEGTLGIITKAILKIWPRPEAYAISVSYYSKIEDAGKAIGRLKGERLPIMIAEFIDRRAMEVMLEHRKIRFPSGANYMIFVQLATSKESLDLYLNKTERIMRASNAIRVEIAKSKTKMEKLYEARKYIFTAMKEDAEKVNKSLMIADIVVPPSELPYSLHEMRGVIRRQKLDVVLFGHIGDGNVHANIVYKNNDKTEMETVNKLQKEFGKIAIKHNGSVSGEHGIGMIKKELLMDEFRSTGSMANIALMRKIKRALDPKGILNSGKIFDYAPE